MTTSDHDDRFNKIYMENRGRGIRLAARIIENTAAYPALVGLEAEGIYNQALNKYYINGGHRDERDDHWPLLSHRIAQAGLDAQKKAKRQKRVPPGRLVSKDETDKDGEPLADLTRPGPTELDQLLDKVAISDALAKATMAADGNRADASAVDAAYAYHAEKQTYREIAEEHGMSEETARQRVKRGLQLLADQLQPYDCGRKDSP